MEISGYSLNELLGQNPRIFSSGEKTKAEYKALWDTITSGKEWKGEFLNRKKNGENYWENASISPILNEKGKITHFLAVKEDITEKKLIDQALRNSEQKYQTLARISPVGIFRTDAKGSTTYVNPTWCEISGISAEEALGNGWLKKVHPDDRRTLNENWQQSVNNEAVSYSEYRFIRSDDSIVWVIGKAVPEMDADGKLIGYVGTATDISEHKKLESTKEILINISNALLATESLHDFSNYIFDELGKVIQTNNFYIALYQEETQMFSAPFIKDSLDADLTEFPVGKTMTGLVIRTRKSQLINKERFKSLEQAGEIELLGPPSDVWIGVPLFINDNVIGAIVIQNYDGEKRLDEEDLKILEYAAPQISLAIARKRTLEDLKAALEKAQESDRLKSAFLANMSHEIRTPMNGILGFTELLKEPQLSGEQQQEFIEVIERSGARMLNTIRDLIDISTIEAGQVSVMNSETDMQEQLEQIVTFFKPEAESKGLRLHFNLPAGESTTCFTDSEKVYTILSNLTKNAIKYSKKGSIEIGCNKNQDCLAFYVKDEGIGIPQDKLESVFDRFVQADSRLSSDYEGVGLGLSITKAYVEMLGGKIWVESEEGVGSTFYFTIAKKNKQGLEIKKTILEPEKTDKITIKKSEIKLKILLVEDDPMSQQLIKHMLSGMYDEIIIANNGIEAFDYAKTISDFDLILMDMKMPDMDGFEATRLIRQFNKEVIIIAQTAYSMLGDREKTIDAGCNDYISKPINKPDLISLINKHFKHQP
ncbi:MAG: PAS domain S-box protein [Bacteroidales bacterium]|nr:PAS domain S-box protein [Bacteroidales bacterium]